MKGLKSPHFPSISFFHHQIFITLQKSNHAYLVKVGIDFPPPNPPPIPIVNLLEVNGN